VRAKVALPPGHVATVDAGLDKAIQIAAAQKDINSLTLYTPPDDAQHLEELRRARLRRQHREIFEAMGLKPITQEDIDRALEEARAKKGETA
jgi:alkanesulfonate monooxygenase SsuD/methylene tetrahydromethanopterin reductase-like flavin-dependent oxidoreductase (luciferase family)